MQSPAPHAPPLDGVFLLYPKFLYLKPSTFERALSQRDYLATQTGHLHTPYTVANLEQACRDLNLLPFRRLEWVFPFA